MVENLQKIVATQQLSLSFIMILTGCVMIVGVELQRFIEASRDDNISAARLAGHWVSMIFGWLLIAIGFVNMTAVLIQVFAS